MIDQSWLVGEFLVLVQAISLATLGIRPISFLLNFVLALYPGWISIAHGYSGSALLIKLLAVQHLAVMVHDLAGFEY